MFIMKYEDLQDNMLSRALSKLANFPGYPSPKISYLVAKIIKRIEDERLVFNPIYDTILKEHAEVDEKGSLKNNGGGLCIWKSDADKKAFEDKITPIGSTEFEIPYPRLTIGDLGDIKLTPTDIISLEKLINPMEAV
jgi:hypothetical protein